MTKAEIPTDDGFAFYKIAFQWYPFIGVITMWIPSIIISYLTGGQDFSNFNIQLLSPCAQKWMPKKYRHTELKLIKNLNNSDDINRKNSLLETTKWVTPDDKSKQ